MQESKFSGMLQKQSKHFPTIGAKDLGVDFDRHKAHIKNTLIKTTPRH